MIAIALYDENVDRLNKTYDSISSILGDTRCELIRTTKVGDLFDYYNNSNGSIDLCVMSVQESKSDCIKILNELSAFYPNTRFSVIGNDNDVRGKLDMLTALPLIAFIYPENFESGIRAVIKKIYQDYNSRMSRFILISNKGNDISINTNDICFAESDKRLLRIHLPDGNVVSTYKKLDDFQSTVGGGFLRCHQSYLVNMEQIKSIFTDELELFSGEIIPVAHKKYYQCRQEYMNYVSTRDI